MKISDIKKVKEVYQRMHPDLVEKHYALPTKGNSRGRRKALRRAIRLNPEMHVKVIRTHGRGPNAGSVATPLGQWSTQGGFQVQYGVARNSGGPGSPIKITAI